MNYKKRYIFFILALFLSVISIAQEIRFELYVRVKCKRTIEMPTYVVLRKDSINYFPKNNENFVILKEKGIYELSTLYFDVKKLYNFNHYGTIKDTLNESTINKCYIRPPFYVGYCCCDEVCDGKKVDYYANGMVRIEGYFIKGRAIGEVRKYYRDGKLKELEKYNKKGKLKWKREFVYYQNGTLKELRKYDKMILRKEYFYDENGKLKQKNTYDKNGKLVRKKTYKSKSVGSNLLMRSIVAMRLSIIGFSISDTVIIKLGAMIIAIG